MRCLRCRLHGFNRSTPFVSIPVRSPGQEIGYEPDPTDEEWDILRSEEHDKLSCLHRSAVVSTYTEELGVAPGHQKHADMVVTLIDERMKKKRIASDVMCNAASGVCPARI